MFRIPRGIIVAGVVTFALPWALRSSSFAAPGPPETEASATREAAKHFAQGVALYGETDYRGALVEFRRAGVLSPNPSVFYNIAETEYQLHDYANALRSFEHYLQIASSSDIHRAEVEGNVKVLRTRVGRLTVTTQPPGAEIVVDDELVGATPLAKPVVVNVGHLKVVASARGYLPVTRFVDVAADDNQALSIELAPFPMALAAAAPPPSSSTSRATADVIVPGPSRLRPAGWIVAGAAAAGAVTFGLLAWKASSNLKDARNEYPARPNRISTLADRTQAFSIVADGLAVVAIVVGALTVFSGSPSPPTASPARMGVGTGPGIRMGMGMVGSGVGPFGFAATF